LHDGEGGLALIQGKALAETQGREVIAEDPLYDALHAGSIAVASRVVIVLLFAELLYHLVPHRGVTNPFLEVLRQPTAELVEVTLHPTASLASLTFALAHSRPLTESSIH